MSTVSAGSALLLVTVITSFCADYRKCFFLGGFVGLIGIDWYGNSGGFY